MSASSPTSFLNCSQDDIGRLLRGHQSFLLLSHIRPDGDAIGSQLALAHSLIAMGKSVRVINDDGLPENLAFLPSAQLVETPPETPVDVEVAIALDTATRERLGAKSLQAAANAKVWINIDHHLSNPGYGDWSLVVPTSPATGEILYELLVAQNLPLPDGSRDALYVAISTDTGSFQYPNTTARTYEIAADLIRRGLDVGDINSKTYDNHPFRRLELMRALLNSLQRHHGGLVASWELRQQTVRELGLRPEDSEGLIDIIRAIRGVQLAVFFEELPYDGKIRISMRSKDRRIDVCRIATTFGGGGHALAAGIRMRGPLEDARNRLMSAIESHLADAGLATAAP